MEIGQCYCATVGKSSDANLGKWSSVAVLIRVMLVEESGGINLALVKTVAVLI